MRVPERPSWVAHRPFSAKTGDLRKRRDFLALFSSADTIPVPARPSGVPSCSSTAKPGPCLHSCVGEVLVTVARFDRESCCWDTARTGPWHCTGSRGDWHKVLQKASPTSGTALTDRLQSSPKPSSHQGTPVPSHMQQRKCLEVVVEAPLP